ncbi:ABC transporter substrate-binding protein [Paenibacillus sp. OAS669]|uniref:ABC transporter substrate-binding protein n=1 Tax=Paenibacillus sp. OAS669 TaxID=2663821 RepID=UPI001788EE6B|nr:extracellular solute-binding protein [Paenibacillus sp. OAS669]MBE1440623.1 multiple sugar transport system substrate-binding protein [Paenibacillus sp. OAS669]
MVLPFMKKTAVIFTLAAISASCSNAVSPPKEPTVEAQPVTLKIYMWDAIFQEDAFQKLIAEPVKKKYPNITLQQIVRGPGMQPENLVASGDNEVDIIMAWNDVLVQFQDLKLIGDMTADIKKAGMDLGRFDEQVLDGMRDGDKKEILYGLPFAQDFYALFYNKDLFDKFGVTYPQDGMTWEDTIELAKKLTREDGGIQYKGLDPEGPEKLGNSLSLPFVDPKTQKATLDTEGWKRVFETLKQIYSIPGNQNTISNHAGTVNRFAKDKNVAMYASHGVISGLAQSDVNWDIAQYPSFADKPNVYGMVKAYSLCITTTSKHREQAMQALQVMTSDEVQLAYTKSTALLSALKNPEMNKHFGEDLPLLKGKHIEGIFKSKPAPFVAQSLYSGKARPPLEAKFKDVMAGKDINTALREAQEEATKQIDALKK